LHCIDSEASLRPTCTSIGEHEHPGSRTQVRRRRSRAGRVAWLDCPRRRNDGLSEPFGEQPAFGCRQPLWPRARLFCASMPDTIAQSRGAQLCLL